MTQCLGSELAEALFYFFYPFFLLRNVAMLLCETLSEFGQKKKSLSLSTNLAYTGSEKSSRIV